MSKDVIGGIAVIQLATFHQPKLGVPVYKVYLTAIRHDGTRQPFYLMMRDTNAPLSPGVTKQMIEEVWCEPVWVFVRGQPRHGWIACSPSVNWQSFNFHNDGNWAMQYVELKCPDAGGHQHYRWQDEGQKVHNELNTRPGEDIGKVFAMLHEADAIY